MVLRRANLKSCCSAVSDSRCREFSDKFIVKVQLCLPICAVVSCHDMMPCTIFHLLETGNPLTASGRPDFQFRPHVAQSQRPFVLPCIAVSAKLTRKVSCPYRVIFPDPELNCHRAHIKWCNLNAKTIGFG